MSDSERGGGREDSPLKKAASKGGKARARSMSPEERAEIARAAAERRWENHTPKGGKPLKATHAGILKVHELELPCYVLEDGRRVLSRSSMIATLGMSKGSSVAEGGDRLVNFLAGERIKPYVSENLNSMSSQTIRFRAPHGGPVALGCEATILADICDAVLEARRNGSLQKQQQHIAVQAEVLVRAFARVGIVALVDEATGYQAERERDELQRILEVYIAKGLLPWARRFPDDFFKQLFRLYNWPIRDDNKRPHPVAHFIKEYIYGRLPAGVLAELERRNPPAENGRRKHKHHQFLTVDTGHPHLDRQITTVSTLLAVSSDMTEFKRLLDRAQPAAGTPMDTALRKVGPQE
ncbi:P63C domain-containing protein [Corallococcus macrosporus]|uniref:Bacteriophage Mx8 p63 C-terminal domain-containing protein n=1 Tax=Myxococcus fulvus (strain ATCC BAA-855 / HW-1) TaxID=483219 RepID=F8CDM8_MYXFH|nr:P63C domain-containing protein [Corallococcus macrosporus]AEI68518.1 hypothetical protein LILAB_33185 [Corallococcus macrosporus]